MIPGALENLRDAVRRLWRTRRRRSGLDATPRRLVAARRRSARTRSRIPKSASWGPPKSAPPESRRRLRQKAGRAAPKISRSSPTARANITAYLRKVAGRATLRHPGRSAARHHSEDPFPKTMYWTGQRRHRASSVPSAGSWRCWAIEVIPFEIAGVQSGNVTQRPSQAGRRARFPSPSKTYEQQLRENFVILSADERREKIEDGIAALDVSSSPTPTLLETLVYLTEFPTPIPGNFDPQFLELPEEVLITVMRHHQKYFSVEDADGKLAPQFVAVTNTNGDPEGLVRHGNERVLRARFNDARFFWEPISSKKLADRVADLANVTFQAKLGSLSREDRAHRGAGEANSAAMTHAAARRAAVPSAISPPNWSRSSPNCRASSADSTRARRANRKQSGSAIYDHYKPVSMEDSIPRTPSRPDGFDRRQARHAARLLPRRPDPHRLAKIRSRCAAPRRASSRFWSKASCASARRAARRRSAAARVLRSIASSYYFREVRGFQYDEVNAVWPPAGTICRRRSAPACGCSTSARRRISSRWPPASNASRTSCGRPNSNRAAASTPHLLEAGPEAGSVRRVSQRVAGAVRSNTGRLEHRLAAPKVDLFFDKVLVNAPDPAVRQNRLALLHSLLTEFSTIADFSEIVTNS